MKNITPQLLSFLRTHKRFSRADLFQIELTNGLNIMATSSQRDLTLPVTAQPTPKNMLLWSQDLEQSPWSGADGDLPPTITADAAIAPDGTSSADQVAFQTAGLNHFSTWGQNLATFPLAVPLTFSIWMKSADASNHQVTLDFDNTPATFISNVVTVTPQWQRFSITGTLAGVGSQLRVIFYNTNASGFSIYAWGAQMEQASAPTAYSPTWSNYTSNLLLESQNFNQSPWTASSTVGPAPNLTPAAAIAPDGTATATRVDFATEGLNQFSSLSQVTSVPAIVNLPVIFSIWMRTVSGTATISIRGDNTHPQDDSVQTVTNVWQRFSVSVAPSTTAALQVVIYSTNQTGPSIYIWGAQLEFQQQQQPNLLVWSQDFEDSAWTLNQITDTQDSIVSPDGTTTADALVATSTNPTLYQSISPLVSIGTTYTFSIWLKVPSGTLNVPLQFNSALGGSGHGSLAAVTTSWQRFSATHTITSGDLSGNFYVMVGNCQFAGGTWTSGEVDAWGAQLEIGSSPSPYASNYGINKPGGSVVSPSNPTTYQPSIPTLSAAGPMNRTFYSTKFGAWERGSVTSEASYQPKSNTMDLTLAAPQSVNYPGTSIPMTQVVLAGLFEKALVTVYTVYWPLGGLPTDWNGIAMGSVVTFLGEITKVRDSSRKRIVFEVADMLYRLNTELPIHVIQSGCRHRLFDVNCSLNQANFAFTTTVASGSSALLLNLAAALNTASFFVSGMTFSQGSVLFTSGQNSGLRAFIKNQNSNTQLLLSAPLPFPVTTGDALTVYPGCDLSLQTCINTYNNKINFGGTPFCPSPEQAL